MVFLDEREHLRHNREASVATLRKLFAFGPECRSRSLRNQRSPSPESSVHAHQPEESRGGLRRVMKHSPNGNGYGDFLAYLLVEDGQHRSRHLILFELPEPLRIQL